MSRGQEQRARQALSVCGLEGELSALPADASTRRYYRLQRAAGPSLILLVQLDPAEREPLERFVAVAEFLRRQGLPVPRVERALPDLAVAVVEDLGSHGLRDELERDTSTASERQVWFEHALALLRRLRAAGSALSADCPAYHARLDAPLFRRELEFFAEHHLGRLPAGPIPRPRLSVCFSRLAEQLAAAQPCLAHRDYHLDNLMVRDGQLWLVDFQDARWGPPAYDVASLLGDRDIQRFLAGRQREQLAQAWCAEPDAPPQARRQLDLATVQRGLKAIGTFAYQAAERGRTHYLGYIAPTLERISLALPGGQEWEELARLVAWLRERAPTQD